MISAKIILIIGTTGFGKSTLANVLLNKNGNFEEVVESRGGFFNLTKEVQTEKFIEREISYQIIDTVGIANNNLNHQQVTKKLTEAFQKANKYGGITQILFLIRVSSIENEIQTYHLLKEIDKDIDKYVTIVLTSYAKFEKEKSCQKKTA